MASRDGRRVRAVCGAFVAAVVLVAGAGVGRAMQILDATDHGELKAEISAEAISRIALQGDRISKVVRAPDGFVAEHDPRSGDLYLRPDRAPAGMGVFNEAERKPVEVFIGTERGFTYRLTLTPVKRGSVQILIRNGAAAAASPESDPYVAGLVRLVRAVVRREALAGYEIVAGGRGFVAGWRLVETWRGPRYRALVLEAVHLPAGEGAGAAGLAGTLRPGVGLGRVAAVWLPRPGAAFLEGRGAVAVVDAGARRGLR